MQNKIRKYIYFICTAFLSGILLPGFSVCPVNEEPPKNPQIIEELLTPKFSTTNEIEKIFKSFLAEENDSIIYSQEPRGLVLSVSSLIFFEENSYEIKESSKEFLNRLGSVIKQLDIPCLIEGNAKLSAENATSPLAGWEISTLQVQKITEYLISVLKINPQKIQAIGFSSKTPQNEDEYLRRIDFIILNYETLNKK